ncbi:unnamed protein product [Thelazia callipaeda]|uniref:Chromo domain-containing protein n=1 Tax=Thelazia callipaeda TaxID=103827 RepID=A0A0N5D6J9_THECL|nr:unnamed protein product [Thelazia callipaeda]
MSSASHTPHIVKKKFIRASRGGAKVVRTYAVEKIVGIKTAESGQKLYKVRWKGFSGSEDSWEPYENLTGGCESLILDYQLSQKSKNDENEGYCRPSTSRSNDTSASFTYCCKCMEFEAVRNITFVVFQEDSNEKNNRHAHWEYETVEVLTPDEWNRFGDCENRELGRLYIPDRIPTETEKLLCNLAPDVGRVTRNKLKTVMKTERSPVNETSSKTEKKQAAKQRRSRGVSSSTTKSIDDIQRSAVQERSKAIITGNTDGTPHDSLEMEHPESALALKSEVSSELLLSNFDEGELQIVAADTSVDDDIDSHIKNNTSSICKRQRRGSRRRGGCQGRGRVKQTALSLTPNQDASPSSGIEVEQACTEIADEIPNLVVDEHLDNDERNEVFVQESISEVKSRRRKSKVGRKPVRGRKKQSVMPRVEVSFSNQEMSDSGKIAEDEEQKQTNETVLVSENNASDIEGTFNKNEIKLSDDNDSDEFLHDNGDKQVLEMSAAEMLILETPELPIPLTKADIPAIDMATLRRDHQNREKPLQTFEQFRTAVLSNQLSSVRWTGRCVPSRRGFDFNQKYRGKTVAIELCERPCGPAHEIDDMLRQIVRDGARLDIPDDTRGRIPLHFAISCEFWCRVKTLLQLRSPVNTEDKDKKTPLHLALLTARTSHFEVTKTIYLLLEYGADVNEVIKRMSPHRNRYIPNLVEHQHRLSEAFDEARMKTLVDITVKRTLLPITVRAVWELESTDWTTEIGFHHETFRFPNDRYAYMILLAILDYRSARYWRVRMWGDSPFIDVRMNETEVESLTYNPKGFVYVTTLINGWNKMKIQLSPCIKKKKWVLMAQVLLVQLHKPAAYIPRPALELAPESGTDWRHE